MESQSGESEDKIEIILMGETKPTRIDKKLFDDTVAAYKKLKEDKFTGDATGEVAKRMGITAFKAEAIIRMNRQIEEARQRREGERKND